MKVDPNSKGMFLALSLFLLVFLLTVLRPDQVHVPIVEIDDTANGNLELVLSQQPSRSECFSFISKIANSIDKTCPSCQIINKACSTSVGEKYQRVRGFEPIENFSVRFSNGDMVINTLDLSLAKAICDEAGKKGSGICYYPGNGREAHNLGFQNNDASGEDMISYFSGFEGSFDKSRVFFAYLKSGEFLLAFLLTLVMTLLLLKTQKFHIQYTVDSTEGIQKVHAKEVSRVGGICIYIGFLGFVLISHWTDFFGGEFELGWKLCIAALPAFVFGLGEDIFKTVGVSARLLATMCSAVLAWWLSGVSINSYDVWFIDKIVNYLPMSVFLMAFAVSGVANAFNIIDGCNGFSGGTAVLCLLGFILLGYSVGDFELVRLTILLLAVISGFLIFNFPHGRVFMGDGGAYFIGFALGWIAVLLPSRNPSVSPWASLLLCGYPVIETIFSMARRVLGKAMLGKPDQGHLHNLANKLSLKFETINSLEKNTRNSVVFIILFPMLILPVIASVLTFQDTQLLQFLFLVYCAIYCMAYGLISSALAKK